MNNTAKIVLVILTALVIFSTAPCFYQNAASAQPATIENDRPDDLDDDDDGPKSYLPKHPEVKKMHLQAMALAEKFAQIVAQRAALQPQLGRLEKEDARLRHLRLKYQLQYLKLRDRFVKENGNGAKTEAFLKEQDRKLKQVRSLIKKEEKIDCYHTIFERKHKAMEEYHWRLIDEKHPLIAEYLRGMDYETNKGRFKTLYGEMINDYKRIIKENETILKETEEIIKAKQKRVKIMKSAVEMMKGILGEMKSAVDEDAP